MEIATVLMDPMRATTAHSPRAGQISSAASRTASAFRGICSAVERPSATTRRMKPTVASTVLFTDFVQTLADARYVTAKTRADVFFSFWCV